MLNEFILKKSSILIKNSKINKEEKYSFIDKIGDFSKRFPLEIRKKLNYHIISFKNIEYNQNETWKIEINSNLSEDYAGILDDINSFYNINYYTENGKLILELVPKEHSIKFDFHTNNFEVISNHNYFYKLCRLVSSNSNYTVDNIKIMNKAMHIGDLINLIKIENPSNSYWKIKVVYYDEKNNQIEFDLDLTAIYKVYRNEFAQEKVILSNNKLVTPMIEKSNEIKLYSVRENEGKILLDFNNTSLNQSLFFALRNRQGNIFEYNFYKEFKVVDGKATIDINNVFDSWLQEEDNLDLLVGPSLEDAKYIESAQNDSLPKEYIRMQYDKQGKFYNNGREAVSVYIKNYNNDFAKNITKIAVLGTCFSRNAFNSSDYFNPDYKKYFKCVYTQFHSTIGSILSKPAPKSLISKYQSHNEFKHIQTDMKKTFFEELKESEAEYLIIDLYPDAMLKELTLSNGALITYSYLIKDTLGLEDYVVDWDNERFSDRNALLKKWINDLDVFMDKVVEVIPENNIILNKGRLAKYYEKNGETHTFGTKQLIERNNYFWEILDNTLLKYYPGVKVIDMTNTHYKADPDYPFGFSYSHYESGYYKEFMNRLIKVLYK